MSEPSPRRTASWPSRSAIVVSVVFAAITLLSIGAHRYPVSIVIVAAIMLTLLLAGGRLSGRLLGEIPHGRPVKRVLIVGAGDAGELIVRDIRNSGAARTSRRIR